MIPGAVLGQWLSDPCAQREALERVEASAVRWGRQPLIAGLEREVVENPGWTAEQQIDAARRFIDRSADVDALVAEMIAACRADPWFRPPFHPISTEVHSSLLLYHHPELSISFGVTGLDAMAAKKGARRGPASINFNGFVTLMRFVQAGNAVLSFWEADPITDAFSAAETGPCRMVGRRRIRDGEEFIVDGRHQSFIVEHLDGDILFFQAVARAGCPAVGVEYDSDSLRCIGATSTDEASSRLQMTVSLLRALGRDDAFPLFEAALASPQFYTRWHVMREMLAMDAEAALPALRAMAASDPHPEVRAAARQTLDLFFGDEDEAATAGEELSCRA